MDRSFILSITVPCGFNFFFGFILDVGVLVATQIDQLIALLRASYSRGGAQVLRAASQAVKAEETPEPERLEYRYELQVEGERWFLLLDLIGRIEALYDRAPEQGIRYLTKALLLSVENVERQRSALLDGFDAAVAIGAKEATQMSEKVIVGMIDMVGSTSDLIANVESSPEAAARIMQLLIEELETKLPPFCRPIVFTGDGLLFVVQRPAPEDTRNVAVTMRGLSVALQEAADRNKELKKLMKASDTPVPNLRVALDAGQIYLGRVGPTLNIIGVPVVVAARLCGEKERYQESGSDVLATQRAVSTGAGWEVWTSGDFGPLNGGGFEPRGVGTKKFTLCKLLPQERR